MGFPRLHCSPSLARLSFRYSADRAVRSITTSSKALQADVVICGSGLGGLSTAYHLAIKYKMKNVIILEQSDPMKLTSAASTECYRNWWPDKVMMSFVGRSIDILETIADETSNVISLTRRGYLFFTREKAKVETFLETGKRACDNGAGTFRYHTGPASAYVPPPATGYPKDLSGVDVLADSTAVQRYYPFLGSDVKAAMHVRKCGWFDVAKLGSFFLEKSTQMGAKLLRGKLVSVKRTSANAVESLEVQLPDHSVMNIITPRLVLAAGPFNPQVGSFLGLALPLVNELHAKVLIHDPAHYNPRNSPLVFLSDDVVLPWLEKERAAIEELYQRTDNAAVKALLRPIPSGIHWRPVGTDNESLLYGIWTWELDTYDPPQFPVPVPFYYGQAGIPAFAKYLQSAKDVSARNLLREADWNRHPNIREVVGGYYCKAPDNRPLIGPLPVDGAYAVAGLSGFGVMAAAAAGELAAQYVVGSPNAPYANSFLMSRFDDPGYLHFIDPKAGQL